MIPLNSDYYTTSGENNSIEETQDGLNEGKIVHHLLSENERR